ncbi:nitroreductase family protein [Candidatus Woesearchaeota archaeon]|nr:nitroreductase family protein [Candidatus Woesearchaeota archaeon]
MDVLHAIKTRRSIHAYLDKAVEFDKLTAICEAGHYAPSAGNLQDWKFILITEQGLRHEISEHCMEQYWMQQAPAMIVVCNNEERVEQRYGLRGKRLYGIQSCAAAIENMLLTAHALGLGACWIGAFDEEFLMDQLGLPQDVRPQAILTIGYANEEPSEKELTSLQSIVYFNGYQARLQKPHLVLHDYSVEWEQQAKKVEPHLKKGVAKLKEGVAKLKEKMNNKNQ